MSTDIRPHLCKKLQALLSSDFRNGHLELLETLGYRSDKTMPIPNANPAQFIQIAENGAGANIDKAKAKYEDWKKVDILFQLTDEELSGQTSLFDATELKPKLLQSYLFFAIELKGKRYSRTDLSTITRQINRLFPMPVMVLYTYNSELSIAVINRRRNKREEHKDVLGKVTLIYGVNLTEPHRGHLEILDSFSVSALTTGKQMIDSFDSLHAAWEAIFNVELLNKKFYRELSNWYFWAMRHCHFPLLDETSDRYFLFKDREKVREHEAKNLIRLLTRILFVWFIKERNLVPDTFFDPTSIRDSFLGNFDPESKETRYYKAILQNLFFAVLNQTCGKREFRKQGQHHNTTNLLRYESLLKDPNKFVKTVEAVTPFLNGGLFDCLDYPHPTKKGPQGGTVTVYEDGFSDRKDNPLVVPDFLFFGAEQKGVDLSAEFGDPKKKNESVRGLIHILDGYKFTIVENTPIEQEIALDPELLGQVFENLLASYNEETKTTARKQTGSFYTPRSIVDYMVDESLKAHLKQKVEQTFLSTTSSSAATSSTTNEIRKSRRRLPHWKQAGAIYWITFRLADSLPQEKLKTWSEERERWIQQHPTPWTDKEWREYDEIFGERLEQWLDSGMGSRALARPELREIVKSCLLRFDQERLLVHSAVIMPNHVHALLEPLPGHDLSKILQGIKGASAREVNKRLGTSGTFWFDESYDHIVRSETQYQHFLHYIAENPGKAGLNPTEYWLHKSDADIPVCDFPPINKQTGMSASLSDRLDDLFAYNDNIPDFSKEEKDALIRAIDTCKILDPACGSGAFPMGALQKLVFILGKLDPRDELWEKRQLAKVDRLIEAAQDIDDTTFRERAIADAEAQKRDIEEAFANNELGYGRKLYLIENCLYGVDIQSIATQVSKLRFFISLVVDQTVDRNRDNFGVRPLPNLETKFVAADTLIQIEKPSVQGELFELTEVSTLQQELKQVRHNLFSAKTPRTKRKYRDEDARLREAIAVELKQNGWNSDTAAKLAAWDPYDQNASAPYFDPEWMFGLKGFDIIIGNPPYRQIQKFPKAQKDKWVAQNFQTYAATADIYCLFYERGAQLLNEGGHLAYITSNKWMRAGYGEKLRSFFVNSVNIEEVLDFGGTLVFSSAIVDTVIVRMLNKASTANFRSTFISGKFLLSESFADYIRENSVRFDKPADGSTPWVILSKQRQEIKKQIEAQGIALKDWDIQINYGIKTGFNDAFYITSEQREALVAEDPRCADYLVPLLRGRCVRPYATDWDGTWMINSHNGIRASGIQPVDLEKECPALMKHLSTWRSQLQKRQDKGDHWSNLRNCAYLKEFTKPKIIYPNMTKFLPFYYDRNDGFFGNQKCFIITSDSDVLAYLTAFFNSSLFKCCFRDNFPNLGEDRRELSKIFMDILPVRKPTSSEAKLFEKLVPMVQFAQKGGMANTDRNVCATLFEDLIDACIMECYFREHMLERDLLFQDTLAPYLEDYDPDAPEAKQKTFIENLGNTLNAPKHEIRNKLLALTAQSPDLLAIIKNEGKV